MCIILPLSYIESVRLTTECVSFLILPVFNTDMPIDLDLWTPVGPCLGVFLQSGILSVRICTHPPFFSFVSDRWDLTGWERERASFLNACGSVG